jgi:proline dehydrogenase
MSMSLFNKLVVLGLPITPKPIVKYFSDPYIAGPDLIDAINTSRQFNGEGMSVTIDVLGEEIARLEQADEAANLYIEVVDAIADHSLDATISVKPTHMGLNLDAQAAQANLDRIIAHAKSRNNHVTIDMEDHTVTDQTLTIFRALRARHGECVGTVLQAYLRRSMDDARALAAEKAHLRLCKGIYIEPRRIAWRDYWTVNNNFTRMLQHLLQHGSFVGIATHDERLVWEAIRIIEDLGLSNEQFEFQMLLGVDPLLRKIILDRGYKLRIYVPFGQQWYAYSVRRLKENPNIARNALAALLRRDQE